MESGMSRVGQKPTSWRMVLVTGVYTAAGGGVMVLLGQPPMWPVFAALGVVTALGTRKRWKRRGGGDQFTPLGRGDEPP
jgi:hypothetical protein